MRRVQAKPVDQGVKSGGAGSQVASTARQATSPEQEVNRGGKEREQNRARANSENGNGAGEAEAIRGQIAELRDSVSPRNGFPEHTKRAIAGLEQQLHEVVAPEIEIARWAERLGVPA